MQKVPKIKIYDISLLFLKVRNENLLNVTSNADKWCPFYGAGYLYLYPAIDIDLTFSLLYDNELLQNNLSSIYLLKVNNRNTRTRC